MSEHFDVAVVGTQLPGVIAAALLAKRGRRVVLIDQGEREACYPHDGVLLPLMPNLVPQQDTAPHVQRVHDELGLGPQLRAQAAALDPTFQVVLPRHRCDLRPGFVALEQEIGREFPELEHNGHVWAGRLIEADERIAAFLETLPAIPPTSLWERWQCRALEKKARDLAAPFTKSAIFKDMPHDHPLRDVLLGPLAFFSHLWPDTPSTLHAVRVAGRFLRGCSGIPDNIHGLNRLFLQTAERFGVVVRRNTQVQCVSASRRRLVDLTLDDSRLVLKADYFINNGVGPLSDLLPPARRHSRLLAEEQRVKRAGGLLVVNLLVRKHAVPQGMAHSLFLVNGRRHARDGVLADPPLFVQRYPARSIDLHGEQPTRIHDESVHEVLSIACPVRQGEAANAHEKLTHMQLQIMARMRRVVPFLDENIVDVSVPPDAGRAQNQSPAFNSWTMHPIYEAPTKPILEVFARSVRTYFKNTVHCGPDVAPGLGLEGAYMNAWGAVACLHKMAGRHWA